MSLSNEEVLAEIDIIKREKRNSQKVEEHKGFKVDAKDFEVEEISEMPMALRQWGNPGPPGPEDL